MFRGIVAAVAFTSAQMAGVGLAEARSATPPATIQVNQASPQLGGEVSFTVTYPVKIKSPRIAIRCYQGGAMTYGEAGPYDQLFLLGGAGSVWLSNGGPASCTAELFYIVWNGNNPQQFYTLAMTRFDAAG